MELKANVSLQINKSAAEVFQAIVTPEKMCSYFTTTASAPMEAGSTVIWTWSDAGAECEVKVVEVIENEKIVYKWSVMGTEGSTVEMTLKSESNNRTFVNVVETGWPLDEKGAAMLAQQTGGWMNMLCCLKAFVEFNINLRAVEVSN